jgi:hypothetical protein
MQIPKLAPQFKGPGEIIDINDTNAKVKINNKIKSAKREQVKEISARKS